MKKTTQKKMEIAVLHIAMTVASVAIVGSAAASELVYQPQNPSFGGNPLNGPVLLNSAITTNKHKAPDIDSDRYGFKEKSPIDLINETMERLIASRTASAYLSQIFDDEGYYKEGNLETPNFRINVEDLNNGFLKVTTTDKVTGAITVVEVSSSSSAGIP